jgi:hypothetical protein
MSQDIKTDMAMKATEQKNFLSCLPGLTESSNIRENDVVLRQKEWCIFWPESTALRYSYPELAREWKATLSTV